MARKTQKHCDACRLDEGARFRTMANLYLCFECYTAWLQTGKLPDPKLEAQPDEERRW